MSSYVYSSVLDDANDYRFVALNIKKFKGRKCMVPYIVNSSFALELYLKSILIANRIYYKSNHSLIELFKLIPDNIKKILISNFNNLEEVLIKYNDAFIKFRYHYELYDIKTGKEKDEMILSFNTDEIESLLLLFHKYCNDNYLNVDFVEMQMELNRKVSKNE